MSVGHYENFPVASVLCPPALRPPIRAIYAFARTADDLADEGDAAADARLAALTAYRAALHRAADPADVADEPAWPGVFPALQAQMRQWQLPLPLLDDLLDAFSQDVRQPRYDDRAQVLDYCRRSANPIGRLLLHLYGITDPQALGRSDDICTALQLINFWQDLSVDLPRGRSYLPATDLARHDLTPAPGQPLADTVAARVLVRELCGWAAELMARGAPLATALPGRVGWELRLVVQGGWRILEKIAAMHYASFLERPRLVAADVPLLLWRAARMRARPPRAAQFAPRTS